MLLHKIFVRWLYVRDSLKVSNARN